MYIDLNALLNASEDSNPLPIAISITFLSLYKSSFVLLTNRLFLYNFLHFHQT
ncbi:hypothetical protein BN1095_440115 [Clostridioides difficile]|uniref:Uncharacterized protein n=1 Tax=Clostridioides difficile TaxID=1496 RepID=A0A069AQJ7_CLODI|nr:hypothetical protein BN1095_440115 [Clostridioides difficile]